MVTKVATLEGSDKAVNRASEEITLCRRIAAGERQLFSQIIEQYSSLVAGVIAAQGVDRGDVEDLAQVAFVNIYKGLAGFRGDAKLSSWIYRIAHNVARAHLKRQAAQPRRTSIEEAMDSGHHPEDRRSVTQPDTVVRNRALAQALGQLTDHQRTALSLFYFEELTYEEIAEALRLNLNTVRTHIRRGKLRLAELLDENALES